MISKDGFLLFQMARLSRQYLVTTSLSLGVEIGVGELPGGDVVKVGTEVGVLLGNDKDVDHVDEGETREGPSETHDTLDVSSISARRVREGGHTRETPGHSGTRESRGQ